jgi:hypothetical protein
MTTLYNKYHDLEPKRTSLKIDKASKQRLRNF